MARRGDYYGSYADAGKRQRRSVGLMTLIDAVVVVVSVVVIFFFVALLLVSKFLPETMGMFAALGLYSLYLYVAMLILVLYWVARWRLINAAVMGVVLVVGMFSLPSYYKMEIDKQHLTKYPRSFKLLSYNMDEFSLEDKKEGLDSLRNFIFREMPNIVTLQNAYEVDSIDSLLRVKRFKQMTYTSKRGNEALAIYSRYPFAKRHEVDSLHNMIWCDIVAEDDTIRIYNISLHIDNYATDSVGERVVPERTIGERMQAWSEQSDFRVKEMDSLMPYITSSPYPSVVAGSLNDIPFTYVYHTLADELVDAYVEKGHGYSHTYRGYEDKLRMDYVFVSETIEVLSYEVLYDADMALHYPLFVRFNEKDKHKK